MPEKVMYINEPIDEQFRKGQRGVNTKGTEVIIIDYLSSTNVMVQFQDKYKYVLNTTYGNFLKGYMKNPYDVIAGKHGFVGVGNYDICYKVGGINVYYKSYRTWFAIHKRVGNFDGFCPAYSDVTVCEEWYNYQNFAKWYESHYYEVEGEIMNLDKDILIPNSRVYSPETCCFLPQRLNEIFHNLNKTKSNNMPVGIELVNRKTRESGYRVKVTYVNENNERKYVRKTFDNLEEAKKFYSAFKQADTRRIILPYKDIIPYYVYNALYNYDFKY